MKIYPSKEEFRAYAGQGNLIPVCLEVVADTETPVSAYYKICPDAGKQLPVKSFSFLLESVEGGENIGRYSILGAEPGAVFVQKQGKAELICGAKKELIEGVDVFEKINKVLSRYQFVKLPGLPPFPGGAVGYASYDIISEIEPTVPVPEKKPLQDLPEAFFMITGVILVFDRVRHTVKIISHAYLEDKSEAALDKAYETAVKQVESYKEKLACPISLPPVNLDESTVAEDVNFVSNKTKEQFCEMVRRGKEYIVSGDIFQVVLSQRFCTDFNLPPLAVHRALRMLNPSPYMFLLNCGDFAIVGASPEVHAKSENSVLTLRPIAGTRKRGRTEEEDLALEKDLLADPKERAEHIMLVDLGRNDLGRIAEKGTVKVNKLMIVERYSHVMHIVSDVKAKLKDGLGVDAVLRATFPAGTLSGAPKIRAMQIISELEGETRGPYGGIVATYSFDGNMNSCITIRTAVLKDGKAYVQAGGGNVADSDPEAEYQETCNKAKAMLKSLSMAKHFA